MKESEQKAFDFAAATTKQLIALCTGLIALTITFSKDIMRVNNIAHSNLMFWSWGCLLISVFFGVWTMMALTGSLQPISDDSNEEPEEETDQANDSESFNINGSNVRIPSGLQILSFVAGLVLTVVFGVKSVSQNSSKIDSSCKIEIIKKVEYELIKPEQVDTLNYQENVPNKR